MAKSKSSASCAARSSPRGIRWRSIAAIAVETMRISRALGNVAYWRDQSDAHIVASDLRGNAATHDIAVRRIDRRHIGHG